MVRRILSRLRGQLGRNRTPSPEPFHADMSIHAAWNHHPDAPAVFADHHLPACSGCAVRHDETLREAAAAYGIDLHTWLTKLNNLHTHPR